VLAKIDNAGTRSVVDSFSAVLNRQPAALRKSMTYAQGREMHGHKILTERTAVQICFADPHSPWQRGANENNNGLLRQYLPRARICRSTPTTTSTPSRSCSIPDRAKHSGGNPRPSFIPSTCRGYNCKPIRFINPGVAVGS
jgi:hypothetical protein